VRPVIGGRTLIGQLSGTVQPGECLTLMEPSGCGKSSLLAWMAGTLDPVFEAEGRVTVGDTELTQLPPEARHVGILFQGGLLFPHLSVACNLAFALPAPCGRWLSGACASNRRWPMPGWPASASATRPRALLLDEPFSKLDAQLRDEVRRFVFEHACNSALPTMLEHDEADAAAAGGAMIRLNAH